VASIGELFVNLGIKGSEKTLGALGDTKKGLEGIKEVSFEAKAAIIGAMYALEKLFATSGKTGTDLTNLNAVLGGGFVQTLQRYQYAARQVGISNEEMSSTFVSLQSAMAKTLLGGAAPAGIGRVARVTGQVIGAEQIKRYADHPEELLQLLQTYAGMEKNAALRNETLGSFGVHGNMTGALVRNAFRPDVLARAPTYSNEEVAKLDKANIAWSNLGNSIEMAIGHLNAAHGGQLVKDISSMVNEVIKLSEAFLHLSEKMHLFKGVDMVFQGWVEIFKLIEQLMDSIAPGLLVIGKVLETATNALTETPDEAKKKDSATSQTVQGAKDIATGAAITAKESLMSLFESVKKSAPDVSITHTLPKPPLPGGTQPGPMEINVNQSFAHPGVDPKKTEDSSKKGIRDAFRQQPALSRIN
jgi:hypothetical protein